MIRLYCFVVLNLIELLHGSVLLVDSVAVLVDFLDQVEFLGGERRLETRVDLHLLQLLGHRHETRVAIDLLKAVVVLLSICCSSWLLLIQSFLHFIIK